MNACRVAFVTTRVDQQSLLGPTRIFLHDLARLSVDDLQNPAATTDFHRFVRIGQSPLGDHRREGSATGHESTLEAAKGVGLEDFDLYERRLTDLGMNVPSTG